MNKMKRILAVTIFLSLSTFSLAPKATAQESILSEIYGRGVHSFYSGQYDQARQLFTSAIDNGIKDPRAYYFRGIVSSLEGRNFEAESDWQEGAMIEARSGSNPSIGRSLSRFQGSARLKLEQIRQTARLEAMTTSASRSNQRMKEIQSVQPPMKAGPAARAMMQGAISPAPAPPVSANDDPFKDDSTSMASGDPVLQADDAFKEADDNPFGNDPKADAMMDPAPAGGNPFGGGGGADPFGGGGGGADPFGGSDAGGAADPFGGDAMGSDDPFN